MKHYQVSFQPGDKTITIHHGATLLEAAGLAGIILSNPCGGIGRCGKCKVCLLPTQKEVLACQFHIEHDIEVFIPDTSRFFKQKILEHGLSRDVPSDPAVQKRWISLPVSTPEQVFDFLTQQTDEPLSIDNNLKDRLGSNIEFNKGLTAVLTWIAADGWRLVDIENGDTTLLLFGAAVDIGTTTVVAQVVNLRTQEIVATVSAENPQARYGFDVISRIGFADTDTGRDKLHETIISCLNDLFDQAAQKADIRTDQIYEAVIAGNTTMNHLLLNYPTYQLGQAPYQAHLLDATNQKAAALDLHINPCGNLYTPPNIAGFVGSDTVAAALACGLDSTNTVTLLVDIGTNGEIVLAAKDRLFAASCAAGPALEGAGLTCGSRAQHGAVERIIYDQNDIGIDVIGQAKPITVCGSGYIDAVAVMLEAGIIDATGRFNEPEELAALIVSEKMRNRMIVHENTPAFHLTDNDAENLIVVSQQDIRRIQLAKGAIQAGILLLLKIAGVEPRQIQQIFLAGAFGNYIQRENAVRIGLLPPVPIEKIHFVGNAAGSGAQMMLIDRRTRKSTEQLARKIQYIEIAHRNEFQSVFSECLLFPES